MKTKFKVGDNVECINSSGSSEQLKLGKIYIIKQGSYKDRFVSDECVKVVGKNGLSVYWASRFKKPNPKPSNRKPRKTISLNLAEAKELYRICHLVPIPLGIKIEILYKELQSQWKARKR